MANQLTAFAFSAELLPEVEKYAYGSEPWEIYLRTWLLHHSAEAMANGTKIWLYLNEADEYVGYGSLGPARLKYPKKKSDLVAVLVIPAVAVRENFWG